MKHTALLLCLLAMAALTAGCAAGTDSASVPPASAAAPPAESVSQPQTDEPEEVIEMKLLVQIGDKTFTARWENNAAARALADKASESPVTVELRDYGGFEKVGSLGESLPTENRQITTQAGDIVLYNGDQVVLFYGSNSWSYTPLGHIEDLTGWEEALGSGNVTVTFSVPE